ncbi:hypothetical protein [uncultured Methanofollis sp.]|uniref:hypothetical protein n=1 Tax=uncultured Methanofollis sp. TaxID=262500 RepID=UPI002629DBC2|nr:hypothetical protein [uncultured Methanofollis sp.]
MCDDESGVTNLVEYVTITGILMVLLIVTIFATNAIFMQGPSDKLAYHSFVDVGNGISTRIVDIYVIAPDTGTITTDFDIPDDVAGQDYFVEMKEDLGDQKVVVSRDGITSTISIAGIGATMGVTGSTTGSGINRLTYDSRGFE